MRLRVLAPHEFAAAGIQYVLSAPTQADAASYLRSIELLAELVVDH